MCCYKWPRWVHISTLIYSISKTWLRSSWERFTSFFSKVKLYFHIALLTFVVIGIKMECIFAIKHGSGPIKTLNLSGILVIQTTVQVPETINVEHSTCHCFFSMYTYMHLDRHIAICCQNHCELSCFSTPGINIISCTDLNYHLF